MPLVLWIRRNFLSLLLCSLCLSPWVLLTTLDSHASPTTRPSRSAPASAQLPRTRWQLPQKTFATLLRVSDAIFDFHTLHHYAAQGDRQRVMLYVMYKLRWFLFAILLMHLGMLTSNAVLLMRMGESPLLGFVPFVNEWRLCRRLGIPGLFALKALVSYGILLAGSLSEWHLPAFALFLACFFWARKWRYIKWRRLARNFGLRPRASFFPCFLPLQVAMDIFRHNRRWQPSGPSYGQQLLQQHAKK